MAWKRVQTQFIAALGNPAASSGSNAHEWGIWRIDPGPRGVRLSNFPKLQAAGGTAPSGWTFDKSDWWLEEHGLIMEKPSFPLPAGKYMVTGDREVTTELTITEDNKWALKQGTLHDVTHLPCRSARYTPAADASPAGGTGTPAQVKAGALMPEVDGCKKQDYWVVFVIAVQE